MLKLMLKPKLNMAYSPLILLAFCFLLLKANNPAANNKIIFSSIDSGTGKISGIIPETKNKGIKRHAFLVSIGHEFCASVGGLISPDYRAAIRNNRFQFNFIQPGSYILGWFIDHNGNGLLELNTEQFFIYHKSPLEVGRKPLNCDFTKASKQSSKLRLIDFPEDFPLLAHIYTPTNKLLFSLELSDEEQAIFHDLPYPCKIGFSEDINQNWHLDQGEQSPYLYLLKQPLKQVVDLYWNKPWSPLKITNQHPNSDYKITLKHKNSNQTILLPNSASFWLHDLEAGDYQIDFETPDGLLTAKHFTHPHKTPIKLLIQPGYGFRLSKAGTHQQALVLLENQPLLSFNPKLKTTVNTWLPGKYTLILFDELDLNGELEFGTFSNRLVLSKSFSLSAKQPQTSVSLPDPPDKMMRGAYRLFSSDYTNGELIFFQETAIKQLYNVLRSIPLSKTGRHDYLRFKIKPDFSRNFFTFIDFNGNHQLDPDEKAFLQSHDPNDFGRFQNYLELPSVKQGSLSVEINDQRADDYYVEIFSPKSPESIAASFLSREPITFKQLPINIPLTMKIIFDTNQNEKFEESDIVYPDKTIILSGNKKQTAIKLNFQSKKP